MSFKQILAVVFLAYWLWALIAGQAWARHYVIPLMILSWLGGGKKKPTTKPQGTYTSQMQRRATGTSRAALSPQMEWKGSARTAELNPTLNAGGYQTSNGDYETVARFLSSQLPAVSPGVFQVPRVRQQIEAWMMEGLPPHVMLERLGGATPSTMTPGTARTSAAPTIGMQVKGTGFATHSATASATPQRFMDEKAINLARIRAIEAGLPTSSNRELIVAMRGGPERMYVPVSRFIRTHLAERPYSQQMLRRRSCAQRMLHRELARQLSSKARDLQPLRAPSARVTKEGVLTGASLNLRTAPPRHVR